MNYPVLKLKEGKEANVAFRHPWVFSGALEAKLGKELHGKLVHLADRKGDILATGTCSTSGSISVRVLAMGDVVIDKDWMTKQIKQSDSARRLLGYGPGTDTTAYRAVFGESDSLPGLIVDRYDDVLVFQISTAGMEALKPLVIEALQDVFEPHAIIERSDIAVRKEEGLEEISGLVFGDVKGSVAFKEHGLKFEADLLTGQKTGFFLDQKDLRAKLATFCQDATVLNVFSYSGAAGVYAMKFGAKSVHNVDSSKGALAQCDKHAKLNKIAAADFTSEENDAFQYLGKEVDTMYDVVIMDPPALIKSQKDADEGKKAYHFLNRAAMRRVKNGGVFVTSSCSQFMFEEDMSFTLRRASVQNNMVLDCIGIVRQAGDHPESVYFPEARYLKSFIFRVRHL